MNNQNNKTIGSTLVIALTVFVLMVLFSLTDIYKGMRYAVTDFKWHFTTEKEAPDTSFLVIAIDDASISYFADRYNITWPWPRQFYGIVLNYLRQAGANTVVFDMHFSEPDQQRIELSAEASDRDFGEAIASFPHVVMGAMLTDSLYRRGTFEGSQPLHFTGSEDLHPAKYSGIRFPIPVLARGLERIGTTHFITDSDGICRRLPLLIRVGQDIYPQLGLAAYLESSGDSILSYDAGKNRLITQKTTIPLSVRGEFPIFWYGPGGESGVYRYDSFHAVFLSAIRAQTGAEPIIPPRDYTNKKIMICASAGGLFDLKPTPFTSTQPYPGGEIHLTIWQNLTEGDVLKSFPDFWIKSLTLLFLLFLAHIILNRKFGVSVLLAFTGAFLFILLSLGLFKFSRMETDLLFPVLGILLTTGSSAMYRTLTEGRAKRQIRSLFSRYLSSDVINLLMENPERVDLEGSEVTGTVLFTDLQGFTTYSEQKSPKDVIRVLNSYFETISSIVLDFGGLLDKYTGDGIMTIFGAPIPRSDHAKAACEVILKFREKKVNDLIPLPSGHILTRIGISSGPMVVGNLGSARRMDYTAVGDTVNLSARLEGVNKSYGTTNIMSEFTWQFVKDDYIFRELDYIRVKGKNQPIRIFTLVGRKGDLSPEELEIESMFAEAMRWYRKRDWRKAMTAFQEILHLNPEDKPSAAFVVRCSLLKKNPDLVDESGVFTFKTK
ncbi:MAG: Putative Adenylate cyclase with CHASE2 sensor domain [Marinimicrobia bacterium 46_47]|nr:MAG: Putative Adenylate cyclase with CHASE2 sensor domain [Marinimicrobia bacterium 46_47]KUK89177.1 MAG: hypothetical protein XE04_1897 [Marinimicrobia bacterium 46_43]